MLWVEQRFTPAEYKMIADGMTDVKAAAPDVLNRATDECIAEMASVMGLSVFADEDWAKEMKRLAEEDKIHLIADGICELDEFRAVGMYFSDEMFPELDAEVARYLDYNQLGADLDTELFLFVDVGEDDVMRIYWLDV